MPLVTVRREVPLGSLRILYLLADQTGCGWYRCLLPGIYLRNLCGVDARAATSLSDSVREFARDADILVFQRQMSDAVLDFLHQQRAMGKKIVCELDDDFWHLPTRNPAYRYYQDEGLMRLSRFIRSADAVTVSTDPLRRVVEAMHDRVVVVPNAVDPDLADAILASRDGECAPNSGMVRIGWSGSNFHEGDLDCAIDALITIARRPDVRLVFFGWVPERIAREVPTAKLERHPFILTNRYYHAVAALRLDIGLAPLRENRFNESKSNLKYLEYSMFRVPTVASPVYPYTTTITDGEDGILVKKNRHREWLRQLTRLVEDKTERQRLAHNAYTTIRQRFHLQTAIRGWLDVYGSLVNRSDSDATQMHRHSSMNNLSTSREVSSPAPTRHSGRDPESRRAPWTPAFAGVTNTRQAAGNEP